LVSRYATVAGARVNNSETQERLRPNIEALLWDFVATADTEALGFAFADCKLLGLLATAASSAKQTPLARHLQSSCSIWRYGTSWWREVRQANQNNESNETKRTVKKTNKQKKKQSQVEHFLGTNAMGNGASLGGVPVSRGECLLCPSCPYLEVQAANSDCKCGHSLSMHAAISECLNATCFKPAHPGFPFCNYACAPSGYH
jgi:hypothetical protein